MRTFEARHTAVHSTELRSGEGMQIPVKYPFTGGAGDVVDLKFGSSDEYDQHGKLLPGSHIRLVDLRTAQKNAAGASIYEGQLIDPSVVFLAIDPAQVDWEKDIGYKGIRAGEEVVLGRNTHPARFPHMQETTSRKHVTVRYDQQEGILAFEDHSLNGTVITSGQLPPLSVRRDAPKPEEYLTGAPEKNDVRTLDERSRILDAAYVAQKAAEWKSDYRQPRLTHDLLATQGLDPIVGIGVGEREFMFSGLLDTSDGRTHALCYADDGDGRIVPHMYYKSKSDGGWRMSPYLYEDGVYSKGDIPLRDQQGQHVEYGQYTQATKPDESIAALLEEMERLKVEASAPRDVKNSFRSLLVKSAYERSGIDEVYSADLSVECIGGHGLYAYMSGKGFKYQPEVSRGMIEAMRLPDGFTPDFTAQPRRSYQTEHTILGKTRVEVYLVPYKGKDIEWHVATDESTGTVWLERLAVKGGGVTKYGTRRDLILAGALNAKPVDYRSQTPQMVEGEDYDAIAGGTYVSVKKTLDRMPWVRDYRRARLGS